MKPYKLAEKILKRAIDAGASDIYWLPAKDSYNIRFRVDGAQSDIETVSKETGDQCVAHIKVLASLLTYKTTVAQDGVIRDSARFADCEFRVASVPTLHGERLTIRVNDGSETPLYLEELNFDAETADALRRMIAKPEGLTILTGPTGCGKTTTIYAMIRELLRNDQDPASIITIEDPVESAIDGVSQIPVKSGDDAWSYKDALKAALRQDVKTLVIGELRDADVAKVALDAALSGHRVITTYHAGEIPTVYARLLHQGFEPFLIAAAISGIVSQRLLKRKDSADGRVPLAATLIPDDDWRDFIASAPGLRDIRARIREIPEADLHAKAAETAKNGLIDAKEAALI